LWFGSAEDRYDGLISPKPQAFVALTSLLLFRGGLLAPRKSLDLTKASSRDIFSNFGHQIAV
jgi:hypothetical protein